MSKKKSTWGFDIKELNHSVRPQDDFFHHVNKKWMDSNPIPKSESHWGSFNILRFESEKQLKTLLDEIESLKRVDAGSPKQLIRDFYRSGLNMELRNSLGLSPLESLIKKIQSISSIEDLEIVIEKLHRIGVGVGWSAGIDQDAKNSEKYAMHLSQDGLGMPDREYYLKNDPESVRVRTAYEEHVEKLFVLMGRTRAEAALEQKKFLSFETKLARAFMKKEDSRDPDKTYHKFTLAKLQKAAPGVNWNQYFTRVGAPTLPYILVTQPNYIAKVADQVQKTDLSVWKSYLEWHLVNDYSGVLSAPFIKQSFSFYGTVLSGTKTMRPLWRRVLGVVNGSLGEALGQLYVAKYFPPEAKQKMELIVNDLFTAYEARLRSLTWMSPATKKKALIKLAALNRKIGYPKKWKSYSGLKISPEEYAMNVMRVNEFEHKRELKKLGKPINREEWFMYPQTVNAYFAPNLNDIVFPAAILQPPFFSLGADDALNYGCIGAVIGHEITHGFDDEGSKFDSKGNLKSWWTAKDRKEFERKAKKVEKQFNAYKVADGVSVNGKLTLGENIADLGGVSIAYDAYQLQLERTGRKEVDGLSPEQRFFIGFSLFERENARPEFTKMQVLTDPHSPGIFRINGPLSNFSAFYEAYGVKKGDAHYKAPKDREMVW
ncbi:M13 family metallopeptidase [Patescibacteria group bacterium]|nr:M13 family metallopeptidase [Patescibacteria group bacterium]